MHHGEEVRSAAYLDNGVSGNKCQDVCTRNRLRAFPLQPFLDLVDHVETSEWVQIAYRVFLAREIGGIVQQHWAIATLQLQQTRSSHQIVHKNHMMNHIQRSSWREEESFYMVRS